MKLDTVTVLWLAHRDPFDRVVAQAIVHGMSVATPDDMIRNYPVLAVW